MRGLPDTDGRAGQSHLHDVRSRDHQLMWYYVIALAMTLLSFPLTMLVYLLRAR